MSNQPAQKHGFDAPLVNIEKPLINKLLRGNKTLLSWQRAYLRSAASCDEINDTQARVIRGMKLKNNQQISESENV